VGHLHRRVRLPAELYPSDVDAAAVAALGVPVHVDGFVVGELPVRTLALSVTVPGAHLRQFLVLAVEPGATAVRRATDEERNLIRRCEVERLADEVGGPIGAERNG